MNSNNLQIHNLGFECYKNNFDKTEDYYQSYPPPILLNEIEDTNIYSETHGKCFCTTLHWGQRKLLMQEIEFLTNYAKKDNIILYIGAAKGTHILILYELFKELELEYHLYDTSKFDPKLYNNPKIKIFNEYFLDETITKYKKIKKDILFISDIRNLEIGKLRTSRYDKGVKEQIYSLEERKKIRKEENLKQDKLILDDVYLQERIIKGLLPKYSMVKFRLPFISKEKLKLLNGEIYLQIWSPTYSTESRLVIDSTNINNSSEMETSLYDPEEYNRRLDTFNRLTRQSYYKHGFKFASKVGMDNCYDCSSEIRVLRKYCSWYLKTICKYQEDNLEVIDDIIFTIIKNINNILGEDELSLICKSKKSIDKKMNTFKETSIIFSKNYDKDLNDDNMKKIIEKIRKNLIIYTRGIDCYKYKENDEDDPEDRER